MGYSCGKYKDTKLAYRALASVKTNLSCFQIFHTDRDGELKNSKIDDLLLTFHIQRLLSTKECHYDNVVAQAPFKIIKTGLFKDSVFAHFNSYKLSLRHTSIGLIANGFGYLTLV